MDTPDYTVLIPLTKGYVAAVDAIDGDLLNHNWHVRTQSLYAARGVGPRNNHRKVYMHRVVMERMIGRPLFSGEEVDHINGLVRDNRRSNLRLATHQENMRNQRRNKANTSGYKGVSFDKHCPLRPFRAYIVVNNHQKSLGHFATAQEAHQVRERAAAELFGEFNRASLND